MTSNEARALRAVNALKYYVETCKGEVFEENSDEIADLIADLLHLAAECDQGDNPIGSTLRRAKMHYEAERNDPDECEQTLMPGLPMGNLTTPNNAKPYRSANALARESVKGAHG